MMQKIQKFGGAMFTPVLLFAFAGIVVGVGTLFTTEAIMGDLARPDSLFYQVWNVILQGGWTVFNQLPLLFAVALPIGMAKKQNARCCMEALVLYLTFHYFLSTMLSQWGSAFGVDFSAEVGGTSGLAMIANIKTLDMGMMGMMAFQGFVKGAGAVGIWVFIFLERALIPFGLHHILYSPFYYDNAVVPGGLYSYWATRLPEMAASTASLKSLVPEAGFTATGFSKIFGCPGIAAAFYMTAKPEKKKQALALLLPMTLTAILCGVTEPIEFTFLFVAPPLFVVHALLAATLSTVMYLAGIVGIHSGGAIEMASLNWIPLGASHWQQYLLMLGIGLIFTVIWFFVFRFLILKFDFKTPGREVDEGVKFYSKAEYRERQAGGNTAPADGAAGSRDELAAKILEGLGGKENIVDVTNCATRLRVNVHDETKLQNDAYFKSIGTHGAMVKGKSVQVIVGLSVPKVRAKVEELL